MLGEQIYSRRFSQIPGMQREEKIEYSLIETNCCNETLYGIELYSECNGEVSSDYMEKLSDSKEKVLCLLKYLYENAIRLDTYRYIIEDFFGLRK